jgi:hypothetical protein
MTKQSSDCLSVGFRARLATGGFWPISDAKLSVMRGTL